MRSMVEPVFGKPDNCLQIWTVVENTSLLAYNGAANADFDSASLTPEPSIEE
jgi:hypothetical protein